MVLGKGSTTGTLAENDVRGLLASAANDLFVGELDPSARRMLVIIPDGTRTAPIPLFFRLLYEQFGRRAARLDYLIALGTHPPMSPEAIDHLVGVTAAERASAYPNVHICNHEWANPQALQTIGVISRTEADELSSGLLVQDVPVTLNRLILDYDVVLICGPVFPHEVAGFSGGAKYLFPGIAGPDIINFTHWLGALATSMHTIGVKDTAVRRVIARAATFLPRPVACLALVLRGDDLHGMYIGSLEEAWSRAVDLSSLLNITYVDHPFKQVLSAPAERYDDLWTAAKAMYKTEPVIADGGEVIIYAPHISEVSYMHGKLIDAVGYHVKDYFLKQWDRFRDVPGSILAHSTHLKGAGTFDAVTRIESPRISVKLATSIPEERCQRISLSFADYREIDPGEWAGRERDGVLYVPHAGEGLYRLRGTSDPPG
jgi:nickel-dependent lactate racemase